LKNGRRGAEKVCVRGTGGKAIIYVERTIKGMTPGIIIPRVIIQRKSGGRKKSV